MTKKINCILLIDDNPDDNFYHERVIRKSGLCEKVISKESGREALEFLADPQKGKNEHPDIIFLDINMPGMNGWEFLEEYNKLEKDFQSKVVVVMLTTSESPEDKAEANKRKVVADFSSKPLTINFLKDIIEQNF